MSDAAELLRQAYPAELSDRAAAVRFLRGRRAALRQRADPVYDAAAAASSGCASTGARRHAQGLAAEARHALGRWEADRGHLCEGCGARLAFERLAAVTSVVRCTTCAVPVPFDRRWCR